MINPKLSKPCSTEDAIRYLRIPDDAAPYVVQCANIDPEYPRRMVFGQIHVVPMQLAYFLIERGLGHLLEDGPCGYLLENMEGEQRQHDEEEREEEGQEEDDEGVAEPDSDEDLPRRRKSRRRR